MKLLVRHKITLSLFNDVVSVVFSNRALSSGCEEQSIASLLFGSFPGATLANGLTRWSEEEAAIISRVQCRIVALDLRSHGETKVKNSEDLSAETMAKDVGNVVEAMYGDLPPPVMLIGHSMGGAIAVHTASANLVPSLLGLCMIDVVEGTAMDALNSMQNFLRGRPKTFKSLENAIEWSVKSGQIRNLESARVSMVGQVKQCEGITSPEGSKSIVEGIIEEEEEEEEGSESVNKRKKEDDMETKKDHPYTWRIELAKTEKYWDGWFRGLSNLFLSCPIPKLLLLAGVDRLDKDLTIGQMQGKSSRNCAHGSFSEGRELGSHMKINILR
ncbi:protein phosphatase methylesterase 1 [Peromyscus eremicus]|uniref:protein phosphatase methylesterase 1 n=1 Tax=Peromyscus eremicus TaxID=42410 RepID=UPI0027DB3897|nr:protein phosphatase methylesterase 1 [Peromyscus eremicus]